MSPKNPNEKNKETSKGICFGILTEIATVNEGVYADFSGIFSSIKMHVKGTNNARATYKATPLNPRQIQTKKPANYDVYRLSFWSR